MAVGGYIARQKLAKRERFPLIVELEPLYQCNLECAAAARSTRPILRQRIRSTERSRDRRVGRADGFDRRRRTLIHPDRRARARADQAQAYIYLCTTRSDGAQARPLRAESLLRWAVHMDGCVNARRVSLPTASSTRQLRDQAAKERLRVTTNTTSSHTIHRTPCARCSTSSTTSSRSTR